MANRRMEALLGLSLRHNCTLLGEVVTQKTLFCDLTGPVVRPFGRSITVTS